MASELPLLERDRELARVSQLVAGAVVGESGAVVIEGPAGAGKTAILGALAAQGAESGMRVLRSVGPELERDYPFGVVRQLFEPAVHGLETAVRGEVFAGAAALAQPLVTGAGSDSGRQLADPGFALIHSLYWVLVGLSDLGPVALVVDDVQWADPLSLRFLAFALRRSDGLPLLVALARRDPSDGDQPDESVCLTNTTSMGDSPRVFNSRRRSGRVASCGSLGDLRRRGSRICRTLALGSTFADRCRPSGRAS